MSNFIEELAVLVQKHAPEYGICVCSPIIAQGILESASGTSDKVFKDGEWRHNYFGLKWRNNRCAISNEYFEEYTSEQNSDGSYKRIVSKFCKFNSLEDCVIGYFQWTNIPNYSNLKGVTDPRTYLENIKADRYATSIHYVDNLMNVIEKYDLTRFDKVEKETIKMAKVFLSAGHGGSDPGASGHGLVEKDINLNIMTACKDELKRHGLTVVCSREKDENDPVSEEVKEANNSGADIAVSFHTNAGGGDGSESFYYDSSSKGKKLAELCEKYVKELGQNSRGIKAGNKLMFINKTHMPAVLCECAFLDNDTDNDIIKTTDKQKAFGVAYAKAILEYLGIAYKEGTTTATPTAQTTNKSFLVSVNVCLNIRKGPGVNYDVTGKYAQKGKYTIVEETNGWGKLKSGAGWITLSPKYTTRL